LPHRAPIALLILLCVPFVQYKATLSIPRACNDHYLQQFQTGRFFAAYYNNQAVAVNDLGSSSFEHAGMVLDLDGLGSHEVANRMRMTGRPLGPEDMATFVEKAGVKVIAIYETWFPEGTPRSWTKVAELRMLRPRVVVAEGTVSFFAPTPDLAAALAMNLTQFSASLPPNAALRFVRQ
jgi:hypothetical protein